MPITDERITSICQQLSIAVASGWNATPFTKTYLYNTIIQKTLLITKKIKIKKTLKLRTFQITGQKSTSINTHIQS